MTKPRRHPHLEPGDEEYWEDAGWLVRTRRDAPEKTPEKTPVKTPEVEASVPEVEASVPELEQPKVSVRRRQR